MVCLVVSHLFITHFGAASRTRFDCLVRSAFAPQCDVILLCGRPHGKTGTTFDKKKTLLLWADREKAQETRRTFHPTLYSLVCAGWVWGVGVRHKPEKSRNNRLTARAHAQQISALLFPSECTNIWRFYLTKFLYICSYVWSIFRVPIYTLDFGRARNWFKLYTPVPSYICIWCEFKLSFYKVVFFYDMHNKKAPPHSHYLFFVSYV